MNNGEIKGYQPVIIIGAGRSGTNMLRDTLAQLPGFGTWPCDEINYIWRHGNTRKVNDEFSPELATPRAKKFIQTKFNELAKAQNISYVVEKTCANSLRVGFINKVFPNAKFIWIIRDGRDVVASAQKRWTASLDIPYILRKARFVPMADIPYYAYKYLGSRVYRFLSSERRLAFWGPKFNDMDEALKQYSLPEVCAMQWQRCVEKADMEFSQLESERVLYLRYEDFVYNPATELVKIRNFLQVDISEELSTKIVQDISKTNVGKWQDDLDESILKLIYPIIEDTLRKHGYL
ncbi:sulfotransferase [Oxynema sp. CENA135]|uniref:sulfotransferase family protein n=1 Tax=Oxynema sp. CENA135 TaxID=984206 RepID=UPI00190ADBD5|nr:sulfotransferase [Oxynema sp. CENA135]MBK4730631.1 sulfotransferase [Oxynema sp. CENA135]